MGWLTVIVLLALNVLLTVLLPVEQTLHFGAITFPARSIHKPFLLLNGVLVLYLLCARRGTSLTKESRDESLKPWGVALVAVMVYLPALGVNIWDHDWTHRHIGAGIDSWSRVWQLFTVPMNDGMYRPLAFLTFWLDYQVFGTTLWGYHVQSIGLHALNAVLVGMLAQRLGFDGRTSRTTALLYAVAAVHFETVLWPAARFDLLAATFSAVSLMLLLKWWRTPTPGSWRYAAGALSTYVLAVLNKETAYSLVLLVPALLATRSVWGLPDLGPRKAIGYVGALTALTVTLLAIRLALFNGVGGYGYGGTAGTLTWKSVYLLIVNSLAISVFGINGAIESLGGKVVAAGWACVAVAFGVLYEGGPTRRKTTLAVLVLLSAAPALTVMGWIQPSMIHSRHLYWPSAWMAMLLAESVGQTSRRMLMTSALLAIQLGGLSYNLWVYHELLAGAQEAAALIGREIGDARAEVRLIGVPESPNGVLYFQSELAHRVRRAAPASTVRLCDNAEQCGRATIPVAAYVWDAASSTVRRR